MVLMKFRQVQSLWQLAKLSCSIKGIRLGELTHSNNNFKPIIPRHYILHFRLPCFVDNLDGNIIKWSTEELILAVGSTLIDKSFRLETSENGNTLVIPDAGREHEGLYICETSYPTKTPEIVHTVKMRGKPYIWNLYKIAVLFTIVFILYRLGGFLDWSWKEIGLALVSMTAGLFWVLRPAILWLSLTPSEFGSLGCKILNNYYFKYCDWIIFFSFNDEIRIQAKNVSVLQDQVGWNCTSLLRPSSGYLSWSRSQDKKAAQQVLMTELDNLRTRPIKCWFRSFLGLFNVFGLRSTISKRNFTSDTSFKAYS